MLVKKNKEQITKNRFFSLFVVVGSLFLILYSLFFTSAPVVAAPATSLDPARRARDRLEGYATRTPSVPVSEA